MAKRLKITQTRSAINRHFKQKRTIKALGISRLNRPVTHDDTPQIRGMVYKVRHLLHVEEVD
jgi:large subunit ribosomal protein L30